MSGHVSWRNCAPAGADADTGQDAVSTPGAKSVSTPRLSLLARWLVWWGRMQITLGLLIPVHVRRGGWRQRLADGLLHRGADCLVRAYRMGVRS